MSFEEFKAKTRRILLIAGTAGVLLGWTLFRADPGTPGRGYWPWFAAGGLVVFVAVVVGWWNRHVGSVGIVGRVARKGKRNNGTASTWTLWRKASGRAMRRKAKFVRPSMVKLSWWRRRRMPTWHFAARIARVGMVWVWSSIEDVVLVFGGPRSGKSGWLVGPILDAAGAVVVTTTKIDIVNWTAPLREQKSGPVYLFNPSGIAGRASTITFDPVSGCADPVTAAERAEDLLSAAAAPGAAGGDREFWAEQARRVLACLLHAAALSEASMREVLDWVARPDEGATEVQRALRRSPEDAYQQHALQFLQTADRTRSSICATIMPALSWLTNPTAAAAAAPGETLDVEKLLAERGTVYILGQEEAHVAPLTTALTGHLAREARRLSALAPSGRLDPEFRLALDEAANICPVPLDKWTSDFGGRGIPLFIVAQSRAQLKNRWGENGAEAIVNNAAVQIVYAASVQSGTDLAEFSTLTGEREEENLTRDSDGKITSKSTNKVPVLSPAQLRALGEDKVLILRRGMPAAIGKVRLAWHRRDVKRLFAQQARAARAAEKQAIRRAKQANKQVLDEPFPDHERLDTASLPALPAPRHGADDHDDGPSGTGDQP